MQNGNSTKDREIVLTRILNAPRQLVWQVWTDPKHIDKWWGPNGFKNETHSMEVKPGGAWTYIMHGPEKDFNNKIAYTKVEEPACLEYFHSDGEEPPQIFFNAIVTFDDLGGKTKLTMKTIFPSAEALRKVVEENGAIEGGKQTINRLELHLAEVLDKKEFTILREIDAPKQLVWEMLTKAEHLKHWWGPAGLAMQTATVDLRPGGLFHYGMTAPDGNEMWGKFTYREIEEPNKLVFTNSFSDANGGTTRAPFPGLVWPLEVLNILTLTEIDGKTILTLSGYPVDATQEEETSYGTMHSSMQQGFGGTFDQLDAYLEKIKQTA